MTHSKSLFNDKFFQISIFSTGASILACLSLHILTIMTMAGAIGWFSKVEHVLIFAAVASLLLTIYAVVRHKIRHMRVKLAQ